MKQVFFSASRDTSEDRLAAQEVLKKLNTYCGIKISIYDFLDDETIGTGVGPLQSQIMPQIENGLDLVICFIGERLGMPLPPNFELSKETIAFIDKNERLKQALVLSGTPGPDQIPLTGVVAEVLTAQAHEVPVLFFCKGRTSFIFQHDNLDVFARLFGMGTFRSKVFANDAPVSLSRLQNGFKDQLEQVAAFYKAFNMEGQNTYCYETAEDLSSTLKKALETKFGTGKVLRTDGSAFKGLSYFDIGDTDLFKGRDFEIGRIFEKLSALAKSARPDDRPILTLTGQSGFGKSSLLRAGLAGALETHRTKPSAAVQQLGETYTYKPVLLTPLEITAALDARYDEEGKEKPEDLDDKRPRLWAVAEAIAARLGLPQLFDGLDLAALEALPSAYTANLLRNTLMQSDREQPGGRCRPFLGLDQFDHALAESDPHRRARINVRWRGVLQAIDSLCQSRDMIAVVCIGHLTPRPRSINPQNEEPERASGAYAVWRDGGEALEGGDHGGAFFGLRPVPQYDLSAPTSTLLQEAFRQAFACSGIDLSSGVNERLIRLSARGNIDFLLPMFSVAMRITAGNREARLERFCDEECWREGLVEVHGKRGGRAGALAWASRYLSEKDLELQECDFAPIEGAIDTLAEDTLAAFIQEDLGLEQAESYGRRKPLSSKNGQPSSVPDQAKNLLEVLFRWLLRGPSPLEDTPFLRQIADRERLASALAGCIEKTGETAPAGPRKIAEALLSKFEAARLIRAHSRRNIEFSHDLLLESWNRLKVWTDAESSTLASARELYESAKKSFQDGHGDGGQALAYASPQEILRWAEVYARWGIRFDWPALKIQSKPIPVRDMLRKRLLAWGLEPADQERPELEQAEKAFWTMIAARDDESAVQLVRAYSGLESYKFLLDSRAPSSISDRRSPAIVLTSQFAMRETACALAKLCAEPFAIDRHGHSVFHFAAAHDEAELLKVLYPQLLELRRRRKYAKKQKLAWPPAAPSNNGWSPLHFAVRSGSIKVVRQIVEAMQLAPFRRRLSQIRAGYDHPFEGATALHLAARRRRDDALKVLEAVLQYSGYDGFDERKVPDDAQALPIHHAAQTDNARVIARLLKKRRSDHSRKAMMSEASRGDTPIVIAARRGCTEALKALIDSYAIIQLSWLGTGEALRLAAGYGRTECVRILLAAGKSKSLASLQQSVDAEERTALHLAAQYRRVDVLKLLLSHRSARTVINQQDALGRTPLHLAADYKTSPEEYNAIQETLELLLKNGANPALRNCNELTAFGVAAASHLDVACRVLLEHGGEGSITLEDVFAAFGMRNPVLNRRLLEKFLAKTPPAEFPKNRSAAKGHTLLHGVASFGDVDSCAWLIDRAPGLVNATDKEGQTPLHQAALGGHSDVISLLATNGAGLAAQNSRGRTALHLAAYADRTDAATTLLAEANRRKLEIAGIRDEFGKTALHGTAEIDSTKIAEALLAAGADPLEKTNVDNFGRTPAHIAAFYGARSILELLAPYAYTLEDNDATNSSTVHSAASGGRPQTLNWLRENRPELYTANLNRSNDHGHTPLSLAIARYSKSRRVWEKAGMLDGRTFKDLLPAARRADDGVWEIPGHTFSQSVSEDGEKETSQPRRRPSMAAAALAIKDLLENLDRARARPDARSVFEALMSNDSLLLDLLLERGADVIIAWPACTAGTNLQPVHRAVYRRDAETIKKLLQRNNAALWDARDERGQTPLHLAAHLNYPELIDLLVWNGSWWEAGDARGNTPFTTALANNSTLAYDALCNQPSLPVGLDTSLLLGEDAVFAFASKAASKDDLAALRPWVGDKPSEELRTHIMIAAVRAGAETVARWVHAQDPEALFRRPSVVEAVKTKWQTDPALCQGLRLGHRLTADLAGKDELRARLRVEYSGGNSLLHFAAFGGVTDICDFLINLDAAGTPAYESSAIPLRNIRNQARETPFMQAAVGLQPQTLVWFLSHFSGDEALGDLVAERDIRKQTALHKAAFAKIEPKSPFCEERRIRKRETLDVLIDADADPLAEDRNRRTPADVARANGDLENADYLERVSSDRASGIELLLEPETNGTQAGMALSTRQLAEPNLLSERSTLAAVISERDRGNWASLLRFLFKSAT